MSTFVIKADSKAISSALVKQGNRPPDLFAFEEQMVQFFVTSAEFLSVPKSVAAIYGIIFATYMPLSFADIENRLKLSKGSISQGLRVLKDIGAIKDVSKNEDRCERYVPDLELRLLVLRYIENRVQRNLNAGSSRLIGLRNLAREMPSPNHKIFSQRIHKLQQWHSRSQALLPIMKKFLAIAG